MVVVGGGGIILFRGMTARPQFAGARRDQRVGQKIDDD